MPNVLPGVSASCATPPTNMPTPASPSRIPATSSPFSRQVRAAIDEVRNTRIGSMAISSEACP